MSSPVHPALPGVAPVHLAAPWGCGSEQHVSRSGKAEWPPTLLAFRGHDALARSYLSPPVSWSLCAPVRESRSRGQMRLCFAGCWAPTFPDLSVRFPGCRGQRQGLGGPGCRLCLEKAMPWCLRAAFTNCHRVNGLKQKLTFL